MTERQREQIEAQAARCFAEFSAWWSLGHPERDALSALEGFIAAWPLSDPEDRHALALAMLPMVNAAGIIQVPER
ncbi:MAG TPA: hypothetical protein VGJ60_07005 [Chloroflexota bacterium]|jgi:hypothetical protein